MIFFLNIYVFKKLLLKGTNSNKFKEGMQQKSISEIMENNGNQLQTSFDLAVIEGEQKVEEVIDKKL